jgi:hypothetical protein
MALPSIALACDNDHHWRGRGDNTVNDSSSERARIRAYERQLERQRQRAAEKAAEIAAEKARDLERMRRLEEERNREVRSRTFLYRRSPRRDRRWTRRSDTSRRHWDHGVGRRGYDYSKPTMNSRKLARVMEALADESFSEGQRAVIAEAGRRFEITVNQAIQMVSVLSFDKDRVEALAGLYPSVVDPDNFTTVYRLLTFSSDRKELRRRVRRLS